ncbi:MAG: DUF4440 domain-containing protein [Muribaculaceae bacterium]|nr:DUF4440 domain-containing protein [Muribaculaceae bacterium]
MEEKLVLEPDATKEDIANAKNIWDLEKEALALWFNGQTSGYNNLWSRQSFSYFDGVVEKRIDSHEDIEKVLQTIEGKLFAPDGYRLENPRVQIFGDTAILTFQIYANTTLIDMKYNCIEVYHKESNGEWHVVHSTRFFIRPMDMDFGKAKQVV